MRVLVASWLGSTNLGDELLFRALVTKLHARGATVAGVSTDPEATRAAHGVPAIDHRDPHALMRAAGQADAVVFGGGGLLQDTTSAFNLPYHLSRVTAARLKGTPTAGVGLGVGPISTGLGRRLVRATMSPDMPIAVRDEPSARRLAELGRDGAVVAADLALSLPVPDVAPTE